MFFKKHRIFTAEQKVEAVHIVEQSGKPMTQIASVIGISESALDN